MAEDQSYPRVKKFFFLFIFILSFSKAYSENFKFIKIANLNNPWGSSFLNNDEMIITEKSGLIKIVNIINNQVNETKENFELLLKDYDLTIDTFDTGGTKMDFMHSCERLNNYAKSCDPSIGYFWLEDDWLINSDKMLASDIKKLFKKMAKQRAESIDIYKKNNRNDLLEVEQNEYNIISSYLPKQLSEEDTKKICEDTISSLGAASIKDMGKVMGELKKKYGDEIDFSKAGALLKQLLNK